MLMQRHARSVWAMAMLAVLITACASALAADAKPILLTSIGQSAEASMIKQLCTRGKIPYELNALAKADGLAGADKQPKYSALVAVVGGSSKGLGAAGINKEQELERSVALLEKARSLRMNIVIMHVGGLERRGELSDAFIRAALPYASQVILVEAGDQDGLFEQVLAGKKAPISKVTRISDTLEPLRTALGL
ncbi:MAG: hypothetical protein BWY92_00601 [Firmicutes bacterium ADurb.BinA052]|nr:MAG: hypothetical protein BWY92_00601 [Firmicutes bacterium ADurb.BinA052]